MAERGLAGPIGAPGGVGVDRGVAGHVEHHRAAPLPGRGGQRAHQSLGQPERAQHIDPQGPLEILAIGVGQQRQGDRTQVRSVVDQHVQPAQQAGDLQGRRIDRLLVSDVGDDAVGAGLAGHGLDPLASAGGEDHLGAPVAKLANQGQAKTGCAAGDGDPEAPDGERG